MFTGVWMRKALKVWAAHRMSTSNFQLRHDGLRWRIKLMQNTPAASLFYCRARDGHDRYLHFSEELEVVRGDDCSCCNKEVLCSCIVLTKWVCVRVMTIKVSTLKNGEARQRVMTIRLNTLLVSCYANGEFFRDGFIELFPRGNCGIVCDWLGRYFLEYANVRSWYTSGETESEW